jgi:hypothetical protein
VFYCALDFGTYSELIGECDRGGKRLHRSFRRLNHVHSSDIFGCSITNAGQYAVLGQLGEYAED